jgi:hypothetical protein
LLTSTLPICATRPRRCWLRKAHQLGKGLDLLIHWARLVSAEFPAGSIFRRSRHVGIESLRLGR